MSMTLRQWFDYMGRVDNDALFDVEDVKSMLNDWKEDRHDLVNDIFKLEIQLEHYQKGDQIGSADQKG